MVNSTDTHAEDVKALLRKKFGSLQSFERARRLPLNSVAAGLRRPYLAVEDAVAAELGRPASTIWPSRYHSDGSRKRPQPTENYRAARGAGA